MGKNAEIINSQDGPPTVGPSLMVVSIFHWYAIFDPWMIMKKALYQKDEGVERVWILW